MSESSTTCIYSSWLSFSFMRHAYIWLQISLDKYKVYSFNFLVVVFLMRSCQTRGQALFYAGCRERHYWQGLALLPDYTLLLAPWSLQRTNIFFGPYIGIFCALNWTRTDIEPCIYICDLR